MSRFMFGVLITVAVFALSSFAVTKPEPPAVRTVPWKVSDYTLDRAFRVPVSLTNTTPITSHMPVNGGVIITQVIIRWGSPALTISINGVDEHLDSTSGSSNHHVYDFNPPL